MCFSVFRKPTTALKHVLRYIVAFLNHLMCVLRSLQFVSHTSFMSLFTAILFLLCLFSVLVLCMCSVVVLCCIIIVTIIIILVTIMGTAVAQ